MELEAIKKKVSARTPGLMDCQRFFAVLVPLVRRQDGLYLLYEVRARTMHTQPGEVCFPGGKMEPGETAQQCALRETWEELAIPEENIHLLGQLDFIAHRANFLMQPVLAVVEEEALEKMKLNPAEVDETFLVPLSYLLEHSPVEYEYPLVPSPGEDFPYELVGIPRSYPWRAGRENVPVYTWQGHPIWGLTARITRHLVRLLNE